MALPIADAETGAALFVRLSRREVDRRRAANEERLATLRSTFRWLDIDPVLVSTEDPRHVLGAFLAWADRRRQRMRRAS
jgi:hypothetical protein